jgi:hypothetical protein
MELAIPLYSPFFREDEEASITEIAHISGVLAKLYEGAFNINSALVLLTDTYRLEHTQGCRYIFKHSPPC